MEVATQTTVTSHQTLPVYFVILINVQLGGRSLTFVMAPSRNLINLSVELSTASPSRPFKTVFLGLIRTYFKMLAVTWINLQTVTANIHFCEDLIIPRRVICICPNDKL